MVELKQASRDDNHHIEKNPQPHHPLIITVVLNTNRREDTLATLTSLQANTYLNNRSILLDNASTDGSADAISQKFPNTHIIHLDKNIGYAGNNNVGIKAAIDQGADWIFVLNEDTILAKDCIARLIEVGLSDPEIGILGPLVYHYSEPNVVQSAGGLLGTTWQSTHIGQNELDQGQFVNPRIVDWISGCAIMVRREVIEQIGGLDERFFYYWEETEWCIRASGAGWKIVNVPQAKLWHKGVQRDYQPNPNVTYYNTRNRFLMMSKHNAPMIIWIHTWVQTLRTLISWTLLPKWRTKRSHRDAMLQGIIDFIRQRWGKRTTS